MRTQPDARPGAALAHLLEEALEREDLLRVLLDLHALKKSHCVELDLLTESKKSKDEVCHYLRVDCFSLANDHRTISATTSL